jgi:hypothetical protein
MTPNEALDDAGVAATDISAPSVSRVARVAASSFVEVGLDESV